MVGVSPDRVMLIRADMAGGRSVGSGTLVGPALVLTAAHVVFDDDGQPASHVEVGGVNAAPVAARVMWPSSYAAAPGDVGAAGCCPGRNHRSVLGAAAAAVGAVGPAHRPAARGGVRGDRVSPRPEGSGRDSASRIRSAREINPG